MDHDYPPPLTRQLISLFALAAAFMTQLDATIANVALPHMQGSTLGLARADHLGADQLHHRCRRSSRRCRGWLAGRFGRKRLMVASIIGFTLASGLCGMATNLDQLIALPAAAGRVRRGAAADEPGDPARHQPAREARLGDGALGHGRGARARSSGRLLGGWLTENFNWRWVFFINLPIGILAVVGLLAMLPDRRQAAMRAPVRSVSASAAGAGDRHRSS